MDALDQTPARMHFVNLTTGEESFAQFNPTTFERTISVSWSKVNVLGLSHRPLHYDGTENQEVSLDLYFRSDSKPLHIYGRDMMNFLESFAYAPQAAKNILTTFSPPRVLVIWPGTLSLTCVLRTLTFRHTKFNLRGETVEYTAAMKFEEITDVRILQEFVRLNGARRASFGSAADPFSEG